MPYSILFCASEAYPLIKTGGLADVAGSLPRALHNLGHDVRLLLPAYQSVLQGLKTRPQLSVDTVVDGYQVSILRTLLPGTRVPTLLVDCPALYDRPGNPYHDADGEAWPDNAQRYAVFSRVATMLATNQLAMDWQPHIVHANDWQTGLLPVFLSQQAKRPASVFTIHNLAYQGIFDRQTFDLLHLPEQLWHFSALEYHSDFSFIKGGLVYADRINTVSPTYAKEIQTPEFGNGLNGLLHHRADRLSGILNGIDTRVWNPGTDKLIAKPYNRVKLKDKLPNKQAVLKDFKLPGREDALLLGVVSRLAVQKGIDLILNILETLMSLPVQLVVVGTGDASYEKALQTAAKKYPHQLGLHLAYDERTAHLVEAGADVFLMPSRFEPCGLNQMYSQRYGTLPLVSPVGGLADTVIDANTENVEQGLATGFVMEDVSEASLLDAIKRALSAYVDNKQWKKLQTTAMAQDYSWANSAEAYCALYEQALGDNR